MGDVIMERILACAVLMILIASPSLLLGGDDGTCSQDNAKSGAAITRASLPSIVAQYVMTASSLIWTTVFDIESPSLSDTPPGQRGISDGPDGDDDGWGEIDKSSTPPGQRRISDKPPDADDHGWDDQK
jgi:hypothetical protein